MVNGTIPTFWTQPLRYIRYAMHTRPAAVVSLGLGIAGPVLAIFATPLRRKYLFENAPHVPTSYPLPDRPRDKSLTGYEDE